MEPTICTHFVMVHDSTRRPIQDQPGLVCVRHYIQYWFTSKEDAEAYAKAHERYRHESIAVGQPKQPYLHHEGDCVL